MIEIICCPKCAKIQIGYVNNNKFCAECGEQLIGTGIPAEGHRKELFDNDTEEYYTFHQYIYHTFIEPLGKIDPTLPAFKLYYDKYFNNSAEQQRKKQEEAQALRKQVEEIKKQQLPRCPVCGSIKLQKISVGNKVGSAALFGVFAIGHISKTYKCLQCGYKF